MAHAIVILGGYGNFGSRIAAALANEPDTRVFIAGRDERKAEAQASIIGGNTEPLQLDHQSEDFVDRLKDVGATIAIHTAGPFQGQDYRVARSCIAARCHYLDIADGREYVSRIGALDTDAKQNGVLVVAGASSLPALSSAVVDQYRDRFLRIDRIEHTISSGAKPPGFATMQGVMGYVGKPFKRWQHEEWETAYGWQDIVAQRFPEPIGKRWLANCDVPDLELFPQRYPGVRSVIFRAGIGFASTTLAVWALSWLVRFGAIDDLGRYAAALHRAALRIEPLGTEWSTMCVQIDGIDHRQQPLRRKWILLAGDNHGPNIPCFPAIALARKLVRNEVSARGAMPCMGLLTVEEILHAIPDLNLRVVETE